MLILAMLVFGMAVGWAAELVVSSGHRPNWGRNLVAGLVGSFVGGTVGSLLAGDGLAIRPSGLIGSFLGAIVVLDRVAGDRRRTDCIAIATGAEVRAGPCVAVGGERWRTKLRVGRSTSGSSRDSRPEFPGMGAVARGQRPRRHPVGDDARAARSS